MYEGRHALGYFCEEVLQGHVKQRGVGFGRRPLANEQKGNRDEEARFAKDSDHRRRPRRR
jgi:hypothetical protein